LGKSYEARWQDYVKALEKAGLSRFPG